MLCFKTLKKYCFALIAILANLIISSCNQWFTTTEAKALNLQDSINYYINNYKTQSQALQKAFVLNKRLNNDTLQKQSNLKIALNSLNTNNVKLLFKANNSAKQLAIKLKDTIALGEVNWNYGSHYFNQHKFDSSYYYYANAYDYFKRANHNFYKAKMLYNLAHIESKYQNYKSIEEKVFEAIRNYDTINKPVSEYRCYNLLGNTFAEKNDFKNAKLFFKNAEGALHEAGRKKYELDFQRNYNDIGVMFRKEGNLNSAIDYFIRAIKVKDVKNINPKSYAMIYDNLAYTRFLNGETKNVKYNLTEALKIKEAINDVSGVIVSKLHLAEYYLAEKDTATAYKYNKSALDLSEKTDENIVKLQALQLLAKSDPKNAATHLNNYIKLNAAFINNQNQMVNTFARIRYETDLYKAEIEKLNREKALFGLFILGLATGLTLLYFFMSEGTKTKNFYLQKANEKANQEIYRLMIREQTKQEESRLDERHRISEELHDGILGKIFGIRLGFGYLNLKADPKTKKLYKEHVNALQEIEQEMRAISHDLKSEILNTKTDYITIIENYLKTQQRITDTKLVLEHDSQIDWDYVKDDIRINLYRIIQENLKNIIKHAKAKKASIKFTRSRDQIHLIIHDDGKGFDLNKPRQGIGIDNIKSRAKSIKGTANVVSKPNLGTTVEVTIPYDFGDEE